MGVRKRSSDLLEWDEAGFLPHAVCFGSAEELQRFMPFIQFTWWINKVIKR